ncbi:GIDE domain-containing protein [uncultured Aquimarina sp.]|uniref:GIDE domain-containing protein n=1 Tax=uncultured Aquimarina sp. TaxID=575652 RepID=UPI002604D2A5|nr:GIDE domain-containing protein [uncultured Aquimarina sp.]
MYVLNILKLDLGNGGFFFIFLFGVIIFLIFSQIYSKKNRMLRKLKEYPFKKIQLCKENEYIKIKGKAFPINEPFISPIGKRKCLYYKIQVEEKRSNGKSSSWRTIIQEEEFQDFIIESQGDKAIVSTKIPKSAKTVYLDQDIEYTSGTWNDAPKFLEQYLQSHGKDSTGLFGFNKSIRYREGVIEIGEKITILGTGNWKESDHNLDPYSSKSLYISGNSENKLIITDDPKAQELKKK